MEKRNEKGIASEKESLRKRHEGEQRTERE